MGAWCVPSSRGANILCGERGTGHDLALDDAVEVVDRSLGLGRARRGDILKGDVFVRPEVCGYFFVACFACVGALVFFASGHLFRSAELARSFVPATDVVPFTHDARSTYRRTQAWGVTESAKLCPPANSSAVDLHTQSRTCGKARAYAEHRRLPERVARQGGRKPQQREDPVSLASTRNTGWLHEHDGTRALTRPSRRRFPLSA